MGYPQICTSCGESEYSVSTNGLCQTCDAEFRTNAPHAGDPGLVLYYEDLPVPEGCVWDAESGKVVPTGHKLHGPGPFYPGAASEAAFWSTDKRGRPGYVEIKMPGKRVCFRDSRHSSAYQGTHSPRPGQFRQGRRPTNTPQARKAEREQEPETAILFEPRAFVCYGLRFFVLIEHAFTPLRTDAVRMLNCTTTMPWFG